MLLLLQNMGIFCITSISLVFFYGFSGIYSIQCPFQCAESAENESINCNLTTAECLYGCKPGYAGLNCSVKCPTTCSFDNQSDGEVCQATSRKCLFGCKDGYYGILCLNQCSDIDTNCSRCSLMPNDSVVCHDCNPNFYLEDGSCKACYYWCGVNVTSTLQPCRENDGHCIFVCKEGHYGPKCDQSCNSTCKNVCDRDPGTNTDTLLVVILGIGWLLSFVLIIVLIMIAIKSQTLCKVCCDKGNPNFNQPEITGFKDRVQHVYMTLEEESSFSKSSEMYATLNQGKVCKNGNNVTEENQQGYRTPKNNTALEVGNLYAVTKLETEYKNLNIEEGKTSVFGKELAYLNLETNDFIKTMCE